MYCNGTQKVCEIFSNDIFKITETVIIAAYSILFRCTPSTLFYIETSFNTSKAKRYLQLVYFKMSNNCVGWQIFESFTWTINDIVDGTFCTYDSTADLLTPNESTHWKLLQRKSCLKLIPTAKRWHRATNVTGLRRM